ncbi:MAG: hypothetical protein A2086_03345 [Spirochaetes bacterium GWD1_27_9]|nr:MAG: hypothetical protein A2Z98_12575 [Spirochaetes bacterium GWB1_27_13]OHD45284.1 MAG: hypothetical protein A2086_03345 [Spirochaetes bacterium GWD1_27_9]
MEVTMNEKQETDILEETNNNTEEAKSIEESQYFDLEKLIEEKTKNKTEVFILHQFFLRENWLKGKKVTRSEFEAKYSLYSSKYLGKKEIIKTNWSSE